MTALTAGIDTLIYPPGGDGGRQTTRGLVHVFWKAGRPHVLLAWPRTYTRGVRSSGIRAPPLMWWMVRDNGVSTPPMVIGQVGLVNAECKR